jgi:hypothetical protein
LLAVDPLPQLMEALEGDVDGSGHGDYRIGVMSMSSRNDVALVMRPADAGLVVQNAPGSNHTHGFHG